MKRKAEFAPEKLLYLREYVIKPFSVAGEEYEVVGIPNVILRFQRVLGKLVELIHIDVHQELRSQIAKWQSLAVLVRMETPDYLREEMHYVIVWNVLTDDPQKDLVVD
jgi:hypothetical protein